MPVVGALTRIPGVILSISKQLRYIPGKEPLNLVGQRQTLTYNVRADISVNVAYV